MVYENLSQSEQERLKQLSGLFGYDDPKGFYRFLQYDPKTYGPVAPAPSVSDPAQTAYQNFLAFEKFDTQLKPFAIQVGYERNFFGSSQYDALSQALSEFASPYQQQWYVPTDLSVPERFRAYEREISNAEATSRRLLNLTIATSAAWVVGGFAGAGYFDPSTTATTGGTVGATETARFGLTDPTTLQAARLGLEVPAS